MASFDSDSFDTDSFDTNSFDLAAAAAAVDTSGDAITDGTTFVDSSFVDPYLKPTNTNYPIKT